MRHNFAVKCKSFEDYEKVKELAENFGYSYCTGFSEFTKEQTNHSNCLYFGDMFNSTMTPNSFAFSGCGDDTITFNYPLETVSMARFMNNNLGECLKLTLKELVKIAARAYNLQPTDIQVIP